MLRGKAEEMDSRYDLSARRLRQLFDQFDSNSDGLISCEELRKGLERFGFEIDTKDVEKLIAVIESKHSTRKGQFENRETDEVTPELFAVALRQLRLAELCIIDKVSKEQEMLLGESVRREFLCKCVAHFSQTTD